MLRVRIDAKNYGDAAILRDVSLDLVPGTFTVLTGRSGCGKTTLLRILAGLDPNWHGTISGEARIGYVFQDPRLLPWRTVLDNVRLAADEPAPTPARSLEALAMVGLEASTSAFPGALSMGMARRAAIARAIAVDPELVVMDEPFVSLDEGTAEQLRALTLRLWQKHRWTVLMVTHNLAEAALMADRVVVLGGRPARIVEELTFDRDRQKRDAAWVEQTAGRLRGIIDGHSGNDRTG